MFNMFFDVKNGSLSNEKKTIISTSANMIPNSGLETIFFIAVWKTFVFAFIVWIPIPNNYTDKRGIVFVKQCRAANPGF